jgi:hypothetical protein
LKLETGYSATIHTPVWDFLQPGRSVLLFLKKVDDKYQIIGNLQGAVEVDVATDRVHLGDREANHNQALRRDLDNLPLLIAEQHIRDEAR